MRTVERRRPERHHPKSLTAEDREMDRRRVAGEQPPRSWPEPSTPSAVGVLGCGGRTDQPEINSIRHTEQGPVPCAVKEQGPFHPVGFNCSRSSRRIAFADGCSGTRPSARRDAIDRFPPDDPLFVVPTANGSPSAPLQARIGTAVQTCAVPTKPGALLHSLRHTYATVLADTGNQRISCALSPDTNPPRPRNATSRRLAGQENAPPAIRAICPAGQNGVIQS